jgi:signal transduction histidine kinase
MSKAVNKAPSKVHEENDEVLYTLGQHARHLGLSFDIVENHQHSHHHQSSSQIISTLQPKYRRYWYCDWTKHFVPSPHQHRLVHNVVKEYCQPIRQADFDDMMVGTSSLSSMKEEPLAVRTVTIQLRPDCDHIKVFQALNEAFAVIHPKHHQVLKNSDNCFQAIGADGSVPLLLSAQITTSKRIPTLERLVLLRFYHVTQVHLLEEVLQQIGGVQNQKSPLREMQTPLNNKLGEACAMLQCIQKRQELVQRLDEKQAQLEQEFRVKPKQSITGGGVDSTRGSSNRLLERRAALQRHRTLAASMLHDLPSPGNSTRETTRFFMEKLTESPSVLDENYERLPVFPSLSNRDYDVLQESWPLLDRIWSELELEKCTFNTLVDETSRFGMRPCQPTLDKDYCIQLFQVSQQRMLQDLRRELDRAETAVHDSLNEYAEFEHQLTHVMMRTYNIPIDLQQNPFNVKDHTSDSLDVGQTPISLPQRNIAEFPWEFDDVTLALQDITHTITCICLEQDYDPISHSLQVCERSVEHIFDALEQANDNDQQGFLKRRNRQAMIRLSQQQLYLKDLVRKLSNAPAAWDGLPKLQSEVRRWQEIAQQASNKDDARSQGNWINRDSAGVTGASTGRKSFQVPLLEFKTKFGVACVTQNTLVLLSEMPFFEGVKSYEINKIDVVATPKNTLHKMAIMRHGKKLCGFSPISMDVDKLEKFLRILKSLQH